MSDWSRRRKSILLHPRFRCVGSAEREDRQQPWPPVPLCSPGPVPAARNCAHSRRRRHAFLMQSSSRLPEPRINKHRLSLARQPHPLCSLRGRAGRRQVGEAEAGPGGWSRPVGTAASPSRCRREAGRRPGAGARPSEAPAPWPLGLARPWVPRSLGVPTCAVGLGMCICPPQLLKRLQGVGNVFLAFLPFSHIPDIISVLLHPRGPGAPPPCGGWVLGLLDRPWSRPVGVLARGWGAREGRGRGIHSPLAAA